MSYFKEVVVPEGIRKFQVSETRQLYIVQYIQTLLETMTKEEVYEGVSKSSCTNAITF